VRAATLRRELERIRAEVQTLRAADSPAIRAVRADPSTILVASGLQPDRWQADLLKRDSQRILLLCSRQAGKSLTAAALALKAVLLEAPALVLVLSRSQRQAGELFRDKFIPLYQALGRPVRARQESALSITLANGSRVVSLPGKEETIRSFSGVRLLIIDEAARVPDALYRAVRPMLAVSQGRIIGLSTPFGKRGWFFEAWKSRGRWDRVEVTARQCPRISPEFLAEELQAMGERWYRQEYDCSFEDAEGAVFSHAAIMAALVDDVRPLFSR